MRGSNAEITIVFVTMLHNAHIILTNAQRQWKRRAHIRPVYAKPTNLQNREERTGSKNEAPAIRMIPSNKHTLLTP
jgi:hypothetical protein